MNINNLVHKVGMTNGTQKQENLGIPIIETFP